MTETSAAVLAHLAHAAASRAGAATLDRAREHVIDALACATAAVDTESGRHLLRTLHAADTVPGGRSDASVACVAAAIGCLTHVEEFDALHDASATCPGLCVAPAVALGMVRPTTIEQTLRAVVAGFEVAVTAAHAADGPSLYQARLWPSSLFCRLGAAATSSLLLGLDVRDTAHAIAVAASTGFTLLPTITDAHYLVGGLSSRLGMEAALGAANGVHGPLAVLDGEGVALDRTDMDARMAVVDTTDWIPAVDETSFKRYPCARPLHAMVDALMEQPARATDDVTQVEVTLPSQVRSFLNQQDTPDTISARRSSVVYVARLALAGLAATPAAYRRVPADLPQPRVLLQPPVSSVDRLYPASWPALVAVERRCGREETFVPAPAGAVGRPFSDTTLAVKWDSLLSNGDSWAATLLAMPLDAPAGAHLMPSALAEAVLHA
ncbi:MmgE/PrpD family protein [Micromonospora craniellae]|uniref:MmgE/PrpD family protein n=1 Tax=Micromonospora craniellae TaxID=2294034 RepID=A0A372FYS1_9ACTN|nr:MmgE/PrpD family protein [Micromonospora craniellae]QOC93403.1 MmgE/PrpD family protein [Micromonospora craniellae]RFS45848.1 hypothetical protein D0Q02_14675 [Micromonospora craniellae]